MKNLGVIGKHAGLAAAVRSVVDPSRYHVEAIDGVPDWNAAADTDIFILDADLTDVRPIRVLEQLRQRFPKAALVVYANQKQWDWEEDAYLLGVSHVLAKPIRAQLLNTVLDRLTTASPAATAVMAAPLTVVPPLPRNAPPTPAVPSASSAERALEPFRQLTRALTHTLDTNELVAHFVQMLRDLLRINRVAIFLTPPPGSVVDPTRPTARGQLACICVTGLNPTRLHRQGLSLDSGIGAQLSRWGRVLRADSFEAQGDSTVAAEFERTGTEVAMPILARNHMIGVALFDGHLTGEPLSNDELNLLFRLLEEFGGAIHNSWEHRRLFTNHEVMSDILAGLTAGCLVISRDLQVLHANERAREFLFPEQPSGEAMDFKLLPPVIASRVFEALQTGITPEPFKVRLPSAAGRSLHITLQPFRPQQPGVTNAVMVLMEDHSEIERNQQLEVEASNLRLIKSMAEGMAHEIGNCLVPLSTHQQLMAQKLDDPEFRASLTTAMGEGVRRISRLSNQMLFLTRDGVGRADSIPMTTLVEEAFREVQNSVGDHKALLLCESGGKRFTIKGNKPALKHAFSELILNALQANPGDPQVQVNLTTVSDASGTWLRVEVHDTGKGFSPDVAKRATEPFFTTRNVGLGLGLTVTRKILEAHGGRLEIAPEGRANTVALFLPMSLEPEETGPAAVTTRSSTPAKGKGSRPAAGVQE